ncbi:MAG TPA: homogentisate 1,2-dioxygenase [Methylibium sp.]|uniref:homogentisate 1,2-dioxygenase n=1 Tax=Methylibium sp. TaxID=2067992 RepID=UPI002DB682AA|nr:homogentisate 1,2-dioxygenase [Methylibium sp.]HEU4459557.1 homogentisate 1,2-dioxygenase [Methylibium sp.]
MNGPLRYQSGFGNEFATEAVEGALPRGRNSPQRAPFDLYAELVSGTAFTAPRAENRRSWLYRRRPSVVAAAYRPYEQPHWLSGAQQAMRSGGVLPPEPLRWAPFELPSAPLDFVDGLRTVAANGDVEMHTGIAAHVYLFNRPMAKRALVNADGEMLLVPQQGRLAIRTELGVLEVKPGEIALLPRGMLFRVDGLDGPSRGYVCENHGAPFRLPELGPIGSNGLANARDFLAPVAAYEDAADVACEVVKRFGGRLWHTTLAYSPFDVVAWHGSLSPLKYDTANFMTIGSISFDHPDPSIFTVLTSPSDTPGTANCDFVIFPPRWLVAEDTFRPPWYHRNLMSEFMGLVLGRYDAKPEGFRPGGASLHNGMVPHGPDAQAFEKASSAPLAPHKLDDTLAFMFESRYRFIPTAFALHGGSLDSAYADCWGGLQDKFVERRGA